MFVFYINIFLLKAVATLFLQGVWGTLCNLFCALPIHQFLSTVVEMSQFLGIVLWIGLLFSETSQVQRVVFVDLRRRPLRLITLALIGFLLLSKAAILSPSWLVPN